MASAESGQAERAWDARGGAAKLFTARSLFLAGDLAAFGAGDARVIDDTAPAGLVAA